MFEQYLVCEDGFRNIEENGEIVGFEVRLRIPYYRGIALSLINKIELEVDGTPFLQDDMVFSVRSGSFPYKELSTVINNRWEFGEKATLFVRKQGGIKPGKHHVRVFVSLRISYLPWPNTGENKKMLTLEESIG